MAKKFDLNDDSVVVVIGSGAGGFYRYRNYWGRQRQQYAIFKRCSDWESY